MLRLFALLLLVLLSGCINPAKERLYGTWKSNKELTVQTLRYRKTPSPKLRRQIEGLFGKLEITYTKKEMVAFGPALGGKGTDWHFSTPYRFLGQDADSVVILSKNPLIDKPEITQIHFEGSNRYWIYILGTGWKEYFDRIK